MHSRLTLKLTAAFTAALFLQPALPAFAQTAAARAAQPASTVSTDQTAATPAPPAAAAPVAVVAPVKPVPGTTATTGALRGRAVDPTNAVIPGTTITLTSADGKTYTTQSTGDGTYIIPNVAPGVYTVTTKISGFTPYTRANVKITAATATHLALHLQLEVNTVVNVKADNPMALSTDPDHNASTLVLSGKDLDALSDDPDELSDELNALAGPAAGPNGGQIYIDGFTGGQLPPKSSIREIRINQNPFSAEYDKLGYGRIEVFTKPGTDKLHGSFQMQGNDNDFNTAALVGNVPQPAYHTFFFQGSLSGPLAKNFSYNIGSNYRVIQDNHVVDTTILNSGFVPVNFIQSVFYPQTRVDISPRFDIQITPTNTLTVRYQFDHNSQTNNGVGGNNLATAGYNVTENNHEIQMSDSQTLGARVITETRFEYTRDATATTALNPQPTNNVQGAFTDFGNGTGIQSDVATHYEVQSYTSVQLKKNFVRFGGRLRINQDNNSTTSGFNGTFIYGQTTANYAAVQPYLHGSCIPTTTPGVTITLSGICNYAVTQQAGASPANGYGPTQFNANYGSPAVSASVADVGLYAEDDWKINPNFTLSSGIRYETQNQIGDHHDFAPRLSASWGLGTHNGSPLFVIRGGFGIFYDRFAIAQVENVARFNGSATAEQQVIVSPATTGGTLNFTTCNSACIQGYVNPANQIIYSQASNLRTPYTIQTGGSVEHQFLKSLTGTVTYLNSRGNHQFFSQNLRVTPPNPDPNNNTAIPNNYEYASEGMFKQNQLIVQSTYRSAKGMSLFGFYMLSHANADTAGVTSFPSVPGSITADYGRASFDVRQRVFVAGSVPLPYNISLAPFMIVDSGTPFNITLGEDLNGDNIYNDRPAFCSASTTAANMVNSKYGCFDKGTTAGQARIPINYGQSPAQVAFNLRATKTFGFGAYLHGAPPDNSHHHDHSGGVIVPSTPGSGSSSHHSSSGDSFGFGGGGTNTGRRYNLTIGAQALNLFNVVNYAAPVGVLSSPQFGQQTQLAGTIFSTNTAVRRITLQANLTF